MPPRGVRHLKPTASFERAGRWGPEKGTKNQDKKKGVCRMGKTAGKKETEEATEKEQ